MKHGRNLHGTTSQLFALQAKLGRCAAALGQHAFKGCLDGVALLTQATALQHPVAGCTSRVF